ncbi:G1 family glutamic endopeptidase [Bradyrhizobium sp. USDA 4350]
MAIRRRPALREGRDAWRLNAPQRELDLYGIPPRPDSSAGQQLHDFWIKLVSPPFQRRDPVFNIVDIPFQTQPPNNLESSLNWSGAVVSPPWPKRITLAVAGWIAPEVCHPSTPALFTQEDAPKTLVWVGLDGHNGRLPKISLPQIGTYHTPDGPRENQHWAWWSWWHHSSKPQTVSRISNFEFHPGQEILAGLWPMISGDVGFFIKNQSTGVYIPFLKPQPAGDIEPLGSSAEWVVERPTEPGTGKLYPLAAYGSVNFRYCLALAGDGPARPGRLMTLADNGRMIKMREAFADPYRTVYVSRAERWRDQDGSIGVKCTFHAPT